jgi:hypothetical protein
MEILEWHETDTTFEVRIQDAGGIWADETRRGLRTKHLMNLINFSIKRDILEDNHELACLPPR